MIQQLREATGFGIQPRYIIRDNDKYVDSYYHPVRTNISLDHSLPLASASAEKPQLSPAGALEFEPILGGLYHSYRAKTA